LISGYINAICNLVFLLFIGNFNFVHFVDVDGQEIDFSFDSFAFAVGALMKIAISAFCIFQGKKTLEVYKPIIKEYRDAETGVTNGVMMVERKSKKMDSLVRKVRKYIFASFAIMAFGAIYFNSWGIELVDSFIDIKYEYIR